MNRAAVFLAVAFAILPLSKPVADPPPGLVELNVLSLHEVSGVAFLRGALAVVGNEEEENFCLLPYGNGQRADCLSFKDVLDKKKIKDAEAIDVVYRGTADREGTWFVLSEDDATIHVSGAYKKIRLPRSPFSDQGRCNKGGEGLTVRVRDGGYDIVALSEGGFGCGDRYETPQLLQCRLVFDSNDAQCGDPVPLEVGALEGVPDDEEKFRAPDIAWYGNDLLVLLGSEPRKIDRKKTSYKRTWLQLFDQTGKPVPNRRMELESVWGVSYQRQSRTKSKNWEALDVSRDGGMAVLGYDLDGPSEVVLFGLDLR